MPDKLKPSPAVTPLRDEQARKTTASTDLNSSLEDTFPASDPLSMTGNSTAGGTAETQVEQLIEPAPKVDEALAAVRSRDPREREEMALAELRAMRDELSLLAYHAERKEISPKRSFGLLNFALPSDVETQIRLHPIATVCAAALFGYVWGTSR